MVSSAFSLLLRFFFILRATDIAARLFPYLPLLTVCVPKLQSFRDRNLDCFRATVNYIQKRPTKERESITRVAMLQQISLALALSLSLGPICARARVSAPKTAALGNPLCLNPKP
jgi:hypothetical protein